MYDTQKAMLSRENDELISAREMYDLAHEANIKQEAEEIKAITRKIKEVAREGHYNLNISREAISDNTMAYFEERGFVVDNNRKRGYDTITISWDNPQNKEKNGR